MDAEGSWKNTENFAFADYALVKPYASRFFSIENTMGGEVLYCPDADYAVFKDTIQWVLRSCCSQKWI